MTGHSVRVVADAVARYLVARPGSADSAKGIQQWWLRPIGMEVSLETVLDALRLLEEEQVMECRWLGTQEIWRPRRDEE
jgi:hypothetical protein